MADFGGGSGTLEDPYIIETAEHLNNVRNEPKAHYIQVADIDLSGENWTPINSFEGFYNGQGYRIINITDCLITYISAGWSDIETVEVVNLIVEGNIDSGDRSVGLVVRYFESYDGNTPALLNNCHSTGSVKSSRSSAGGLIGGAAVYNNGKADIIYCTSSADVESDYTNGSLLAFAGAEGSGELNIKKCFSEGKVNGTWREGGLCGFVQAMGTATVNIDKAFSLGDVYGEYYADGYTLAVGGGIGEARTRDDGIINISDCFARGAATAKNYDHYLAGFIAYYDPDAQGTDVGGLNVKNSYATGLLTSEGGDANYIGGLIGGSWTTTVAEELSVENSYWDKETTGVTESYGDEVGKTTAEMKDMETFNPEWDIAEQENATQDLYGWNDNYIWGIGTANDGYPFLWLVDDVLNIWPKVGPAWKTKDLSKVKVETQFKDVVQTWTKIGAEWKAN